MKALAISPHIFKSEWEQHQKYVVMHRCSLDGTQDVDMSKMGREKERKAF